MAKLDGTGSSLLYSARLGGGVAFSVAVDASGSARVTGGTRFTDFPTTAGALQAAHGGGHDAFVTRLDAAGSSLPYSSFLGGAAGDLGTGIALDPLGNVHVCGMTTSSDFPVTAGSVQTASGGLDDTFVFKMGPDVVPVDIDIKPGSKTNPINLKSRGTVPVAILGSATFDVTTVKPASVTLASAPVKTKGNGDPMAAVDDVDDDGYDDLLVHVITKELSLSPGDTSATLAGELEDGTPIAGTDTVKTVP